MLYFLNFQVASFNMFRAWNFIRVWYEVDESIKETCIGTFCNWSLGDSPYLPRLVPALVFFVLYFCWTDVENYGMKYTVYQER